MLVSLFCGQTNWSGSDCKSWLPFWGWWFQCQPRLQGPSHGPWGPRQGLLQGESGGTRVVLDCSSVSKTFAKCSFGPLPHPCNLGVKLGLLLVHSWNKGMPVCSSLLTWISPTPCFPGSSGQKDRLFTPVLGVCAACRKPRALKRRLTLGQR